MRFVGGKATIRAAAIAVAAASLSACGFAPSNFGKSNVQFSEAEFGPASERVVEFGEAVPKGGGYNTVGKPYQVRGQWFEPKEDPNYRAVGLASWYGSNFHGRRTANGEVYDMAGLTAAHPTMPLPSYARVTNLSNGRSVVVRVNDRGPFLRDRVMDVSAKAAQMLDFVDEGTAKVEVRYLGRAPLHGQDSQMLMASYRGPGEFRGGERAFASNDNHFRNAASMPAPSAPADPIGGYLRTASYDAGTDRAPTFGLTDNAWRPALYGGTANNGLYPAYQSRSSYADETPRTNTAGAKLANMAAAGDRVAAELLGRERKVVVQVGVFADQLEAVRLAVALGAFGEPEVRAVEIGGRPLHVLRLTTRSDSSAATAIEAASREGATGARRVGL